MGNITTWGIDYLSHIGLSFTLPFTRYPFGAG